MNQSNINELRNSSQHPPRRSGPENAVDEELYRHVLRVVSRMLCGDGPRQCGAIPAEMDVLAQLEKAIPMPELAQRLSAAIAKRGGHSPSGDPYHGEPETQMVWDKATHFG